jgi:hypothetical protein
VTIVAPPPLRIVLTSTDFCVILKAKKQGNVYCCVKSAYTKRNNAMKSNTVRSDNVERKIISVSTKRQLTIPQKYYDALGFDNEAECVMQKDGLLIRPVRYEAGGEFSEQILADLISQGYEGTELLEKFKDYSKAIRPAVLKLMEETDEFAKSGKGKIPREELFGTEV